MIDEQEIKYRYTCEMALVALTGAVYLQHKPAAHIQAFLADNPVNWLFFEEIITAHKLRPFIYKVLSGLPAVADAAFMARQRAACTQIATSNLRKLEELVHLHSLLADNGIPNVPYKGVILSQFLFGDYISRETSDIDFLIDAAHFGRAHELLLGQGYRPRYYDAHYRRQILHTSHELLYRKKMPDGAIKIEIHWAATSNMMRIPLRNDRLFRDLDTQQLLGVQVGVFNPHTHLLAIIVHHGVNDIWSSLRHVADVAVFLHRYAGSIDWPAFYTDAERYHILHTATVGFRLAAELFGTAVPPPFSSETALPQPLLDNLLQYPALPRPKLNFHSLQQQLYLRDSFVHKVRLLGAYLYAGITPNVRDMEAMAMPGNRYWLYYIAKPFRMLFARQRTKPPGA